MSTRNLNFLLRPRSVALVGASPRPGSLGHAVLQNLREQARRPELYLVNPRHPEIDGARCYASLHDLPVRPDLVVIAVARDLVMQVAEEAAALGAPCAVVITADKSHGESSLKHLLAELYKRTGMRIVGPNCLGLIVPGAGLNASFAAQPVARGDLALISQSGAIAVSLIAWAHQRKIGFSGLASIGDMADVGFADLLDWFAQDGSTKAILLYVEAVMHSQRFMSAARAAARIKPVIVIKAGRSTRAAQAAATHTGALAGADAVYEAAFRRAGLLRVRDIDELFEAAETLGRITPFEGERLAIITNGGGLGVLAVDELDATNGTLANFSAETVATLNAVLPEAWSRTNPADIIGDADPQRFADALDPVLKDPNVDAVMVIHCPTALSQPDEAAEAVARTLESHRRNALRRKPVFAVWHGASERANQIFTDAHIPHFNANAVRGFMHCVNWRKSRDELMAMPPAFADEENDVATARAVVARAVERGENWLPPADVHTVLKAYGIPTAQALNARDSEEAARLSAPLIASYGACVVKILSPDISHKSDVAGVALNLKSEDEVRRAAAGMIQLARRLRPQARIEGVTLHPMINKPHGRELIAGLADDPTFGPIVLFGQGGKAVEVYRDRSIGLPPLNMALAHDMIARTRVSRLLDAYRDSPAADRAAVARTLVKLSELSADIPQIRSLDLNPLVADGDGVISLDARVEIAPAQPMSRYGANPRFAIAPYPKAQERHVTLRKGDKVFIRPIRPEDERLYPALFAKIKADDLRLRFFAPVKEFSHQFIARLTQVDYARAYVCAAIDEVSGEIVGVVRLMHDPDDIRAEYAILVRSDWKGRGLGWLLMHLLIDYAVETGLKIVEAQVLPENRPMLDMCAGLGFTISNDPEDPSLRYVKLDVEKFDRSKLPEL